MTLLARGSIVVRLHEARATLSPRAQRAVDELWRAASASAALHDGRLVSVRSWARTATGVEISAEVVPYRWWIAQRRGQPDLNVRPLAVCGISLDAGGRVLIGRRSGGFDYPGRWELVPSGSCEVQADGTVDPLVDARRELAEEAGLEAEAAEVVGLTEDPGLGVFEALVVLDLSRATAPSVGVEHDSLLFVEPRQLLRYDPIPPAAEAVTLLFEQQ
jgi:8-oxo-dGTP pyrophosphatase MutT (NUDIX family)